MTFAFFPTIFYHTVISAYLLPASLMENDLDSLLDDALADFDKPANSSSSVTTTQTAGEPKQKKASEEPQLAPPVDVFKEFFSDDMTEKLQEEWKAAMQELKDEDPELANQLKLMSQLGDTAASSGASSSAAGHGSNVDEKMKEALDSMAKCVDEEIPTDDVMKNFLNLGLGGPALDGDGMPGIEMMEDVMKMMLSRDVLYPPMKEMANSFPSWLIKNKDNISETEQKNYENQLVCLEIICSEFESEKDSDSESVKKERFNKIMTTVNEMQKHGQPPASLMGDQNTPMMPPENCIIS